MLESPFCDDCTGKNRNRGNLTVDEEEGNARDAAPGRRLRLATRLLLASLVCHGRHRPVRIEPGLDGGGAQVRLVGVSAVCEVVPEEDLLELVLRPAAGVVRREGQEGVGLEQTFSSLTSPPRGPIPDLKCLYKKLATGG